MPGALELAFWQSVGASNDAAQLKAYLAQYPNGTFAGLANAKIAALTPTGPSPPPPSAAAYAGAPATILGMTLATLDDEARAQFKLPPHVRGAVVRSVDAASDAGQKGVRAGDVIILANSNALTAPDGLAAIVDAARTAERTSVLVGVYRNGRTAFLPLKVRR